MDTFKSYGSVVSAKVVMDRESGKSRGFGFVELENEQEANSAIKELNGSELNGRKLIVASARNS